MMLRIGSFCLLLLGIGLAAAPSLAAPTDPAVTPPGATAPATAPATEAPISTTTGSGMTEEALPSAPTDEVADFNRDLLTVEEQVDSLKERVFRSKATLQLLKEIVIQGASTGAVAAIWHVNNLGNGYKLESITYLLDGQTKFSKADTSGELSESREFKIHDGAVPPGSHSLSVALKIRPTGFGVFKYAQSYEIDVRSNFAFEAELGKACTVRVILTDRGGVANSFEERARVDFSKKCERISDAAPR